MGHTLSVYLQLISIQVRSQMQYRLSFLLEVLSTGLLNGSYIFGLGLVVSRFGGLGGWSLGEVALLAGMVETSFGLMDLIFGGFDQSNFVNAIRRGTFDQMLLRPLDLTFQVLGSSFNMRRLGRVFEGVIILFLAFSWTAPVWSWDKLLFFPVVLISQVAGFGAIFVAEAALMFWTVQPVEAMNILSYGGVELMSYPVSIYPQWLRNVFTYVVPFVFLNYYPGLYFLGKPDPLGLPGWAGFLAPLVGAGLLWAALRLWQYGIDHYQSTGS